MNAMRVAAALAALMLLAPATTTPPAAAQAGAPPLAGLSTKDRQTGQQGYKEILDQFGGRVDGSVAHYVQDVGLKVALAAIPGSRPGDWTITVLNSPVPNALATPGGYLYITRGLLAMINSEAELASVLGHEAGHVAARHSDKRNSRATIGGLATIAAAVLGGSQIAQMANYGASAWVSGYSRGQENEADTLGMRYTMQAGYDPRAAATMLEALDRVAAVEGQSERSGATSIFASHPVTAERVARVRQAAALSGRTGLLNTDRYLAAINGLAFGNSPDQGLISGTSFRHAGLGIGFEAPAGFSLKNSPQAVSGQAADGASFVMLGGRLQAGQTMAQLVAEAWRQLSDGRTPEYQYGEQRINGLASALSAARLPGQRGAVDVGVAAYRLDDGRVYLFRTVAPAGRAALFGPLLNSFHLLGAAEKANAARGRHIEVVRVKPGDSAASLSARMAAPYNRADILLALNGFGQAPLHPGQEVKLIVD